MGAELKRCGGCDREETGLDTGGPRKDIRKDKSVTLILEFLCNQEDVVKINSPLPFLRNTLTHNLNGPVSARCDDVTRSASRLRSLCRPLWWGGNEAGRASCPSGLVLLRLKLKASISETLPRPARTLPFGSVLFSEDVWLNRTRTGWSPPTVTPFGPNTTRVQTRRLSLITAVRDAFKAVLSPWRGRLTHCHRSFSPHCFLGSD